MLSTLVRDSSSVLRSRPMGLPRNEVNEKCGPVIPPLANHWQPTEFLAVVTRLGTLVNWAMVWSLIPPHSGNVGPCLAAATGGGALGLCWGWLGLLSEQPANTGMTASAAIASALLLTACTVAAASEVKHRHSH